MVQWEGNMKVYSSWNISPIASLYRANASVCESIKSGPTSGSGCKVSIGSSSSCNLSQTPTKILYEASSGCVHLYHILIRRCATAKNGSELPALKSNFKSLCFSLASSREKSVTAHQDWFVIPSPRLQVCLL